MAIKRISLNNPTARLVNEGASAIVIPTITQIKCDNTGWYQIKTIEKITSARKGDTDEYIATAYRDDDPYALCKTIEPPCQVGDMLYLLETWAYDAHLKEYYYKAEVENGHYEDYDPTEWQWRSPITMPNEACRHKYPCTEVEAIREDMISKWYIEFERKGL